MCVLLAGAFKTKINEMKIEKRIILYKSNRRQFSFGDVAQMVERPLCMREVRGSIPRISTLFWILFRFC